MKIITYTSCWSCGEKRYNYNPSDLIMGVYKITCTACGRLIEGERAKEIVEGFGLLKQNTTANE